MIKELWIYVNITAIRWHLSPVVLFLLVHTICWCDIAWLACHFGCMLFGIPVALYTGVIMLIMAYAGVFPGLIGGAIALMYEDLI